MKLQDIKKYLNETRNWYIVLTSPWKEKIRKIQIPTINRCIFIYATDSEIKTLRVTYSILPLEMIKIED